MFRLNLIQLIMAEQSKVELAERSEFERFIKEAEALGQPEDMEVDDAIAESIVKRVGEKVVKLAENRVEKYIDLIKEKTEQLDEIQKGLYHQLEMIVPGCHAKLNDISDREYQETEKLQNELKKKYFDMRNEALGEKAEEYNNALFNYQTAVCVHEADIEMLKKKAIENTLIVKRSLKFGRYEISFRNGPETVKIDNFRKMTKLINQMVEVIRQYVFQYVSNPAVQNIITKTLDDILSAMKISNVGNASAQFKED